MIVSSYGIQTRELIPDFIRSGKHFLVTPSTIDNNSASYKNALLQIHAAGGDRRTNGEIPFLASIAGRLFPFASAPTSDASIATVRKAFHGAIGAPNAALGRHDPVFIS